MKHYLTTLNERDRSAIILGGLCLLLYLFYQFIYSPLNSQINQKSSLLSEKIATLSWMKKQKISLSNKMKKNIDNSQLLTLLSTQLKENRQLKFPYQLQQTGSGEVQLTFETVPFKLFLSWLETIDKDYNIIVKQFDVDPTETPGVTRLMIIISTV